MSTADDYPITQARGAITDAINATDEAADECSAMDCDRDAAKLRAAIGLLEQAARLIDAVLEPRQEAADREPTEDELEARRASRRR